MLSRRDIKERPTAADWLDALARLVLWVLAVLTVAVVAYASAILFRS